MSGEASDWKFQDNRAVTKWVQWLAWGTAALAGLTAAFIFLGYRSPFPLLWLIGFIASVLLGLRWLYVANANARAMGATDMMGGPVMALVWYFIPLANLGMPYVIMRDVWRGSERPRDLQGADSPGLVMLWWACWIIFYLGLSFAGNVVAREDPDLMPLVQVALLVAFAAFVPAAILYAQAVAGIQRLQESNAPAQLFR